MVRGSLKGERLERSWRTAEPDNAGVALAGRDRSDAVAWVRGRLAWEHRLADLRERATATDDTATVDTATVDTVVDGGPDAVPLAE